MRKFALKLVVGAIAGDEFMVLPRTMYRRLVAESELLAQLRSDYAEVIEDREALRSEFTGVPE